MNIDDPKLTAFALGELPEPERSAMARAVAASPEAQAFVEETQSVAGLLRGELQQDLARAEAKPLNILPLPQEHRADSRWGSLALAALVAIGAIVAAVLLSPGWSGSGGGAGKVAKRDTSIVMEMEMTPSPVAPGRSEFAPIGAGVFVPTAANPFSSFWLNVDSSRSFAEMRRAIGSGRRPPREMVRIEALVNFFSYDYAPPANNALAMEVEAASCPWAPEHHLVRISIQARVEEDAPHEVVAREAVVTVIFDEECVVSYRLIGYEQQQQELGPDAGSEAIEAGRQVTAFYEIVPAKGGRIGEWMEVQLGYFDTVSQQHVEQKRQLKEEPVPFSAAGAEFRFAAAVAEFGLVLRGAEQAGSASLATALQRAEEAQGPDRAGKRLAFLELIRRAQTVPF